MSVKAKILLHLFFPFVFCGIGLVKIYSLIVDQAGIGVSLIIWLGFILGVIIWISESFFINTLTTLPGRTDRSGSDSEPRQITEKQINAIIYLIVTGGYTIGVIGLLEFIIYVHPGITEYNIADLPAFNAILLAFLFTFAIITSTRRIISYREEQ